MSKALRHILKDYPKSELVEFPDNPGYRIRHKAKTMKQAVAYGDKGKDVAFLLIDYSKVKGFVLLKEKLEKASKDYSRIEVMPLPPLLTEAV